MSTEHVTNASPLARALAGTHEQRKPKASAHSLDRLVSLPSNEEIAAAAKERAGGGGPLKQNHDPSLLASLEREFIYGFESGVRWMMARQANH